MIRADVVVAVPTERRCRTVSSTTCSALLVTEGKWDAAVDANRTRCRRAVEMLAIREAWKDFA